MASKVEEFLARRRQHIPIRTMAGGTAAVALSPKSRVDEERQRQKEKEAEEEEEERREEKREARLDRRMQREVERRVLMQAQLAAITGRGNGNDNGNGHGGPDVAEAIRAAMAPVVGELQALRQSQRDDALLLGIKNLTDEVKSSRSAAPAIDPSKAIEQGIENATSMLGRAKDLVAMVTPQPAAPSNTGPNGEVMLSRTQVLQQLAIEEEVALRKADLRDRMENREWEKEKVREEFKEKRERTDKMFQGLQEIAVPALGALFGERVVNEMMKRAGVTAGETVPAPSVGVPQQQQPQLVRWQCHNCGSVNAAQAGQTIVECPNCGSPGRLGPQPPQLHQHQPQPEAGPPLQVLDGGSGEEMMGGEVGDIDIGTDETGDPL